MLLRIPDSYDAKIAKICNLNSANTVMVSQPPWYKDHLALMTTTSYSRRWSLYQGLDLQYKYHIPCNRFTLSGE